MANRLVMTLVVVTIGTAAACSSQPPAPAQEEKPAAATPAPAPPAPAGPVSPPTTDSDMIKSAMSAAPESVSKDATIIAIDAKMQIRTLREGSNGWTCLPDTPSPGVDPMCLDKNGVAWMQAWMAHKTPPVNKMGFGYMLMGGSDASNDDPFAEKPAEGQSWVDTGPHVMILNIGNQFEGYPANHDDPTKPYIMFPNTPYRHLMMPVK